MKDFDKFAFNSVMCFLITVIPSAYGQKAAVPPRKANVDFRVVDKYMRELPYFVANFINRTTGEDFKDSFKGLSAVNIPWGDYNYVLARREAGLPEQWTKKIRFGDIKRRITLDDPNVATLLQAPETLLDADGRPSQDGDSGAVYFTGKIAPISAASVYWVRLLSPLKELKVHDAKIEKDGSFIFNSPANGLLLVVVTKDDQVVFTGTIEMRNRISDRVPIVIDLEKKQVKFWPR